MKIEEVFYINREDFLIYNQNIIYFDSAATTLKPKILSETLADYYNNYSANAHRGEYGISLRVNEMYEKSRKLVANFINASESEIIFTNNTTDSLNKIVIGFFENYLSSGDEVLLTKSEHASNVLPWFELVKKKGIIVNYISLNDDLALTLENVKSAITERTKVISISHITNVVGDIRPVKEIVELARQHNVLVVCDGAQSVPHMKVDVKDLDVDFLAFSAHKMCGPTGLGILYGKMELLRQFKPVTVGGGMNSSFDFNGDIIYSKIPHCFEAGTPNIAGVIAFGAIIEYLNSIGIDNIHDYEKRLREYAIAKLEEIPNILIYNKHSESGIITFNLENVFAQDIAVYLNKQNICIRAGTHCSKILKSDLGIKNTCRISLYFYNNEEEIDILVSALKNENIINEII